MNIRELQDCLQIIATVYEQGGVSKQSREIRALIAAMDGSSEQSVEEFAAALQTRLTARLTEKLSEAKQSLDVVVIDEFVAALTNAETHWDLFNTTFTKLKSDKRVRTGEAAAIANNYKRHLSGKDFEYRFATKTEATEFIFRNFSYLAQGDEKAKIIDGMKRWGSG